MASPSFTAMLFRFVFAAVLRCFLHSFLRISDKTLGWTLKRWYLRSFLPVTVPNPCKLEHCLHFWTRFFALMNAKNAGIYTFFQKIEDRDTSETL